MEQLIYYVCMRYCYHYDSKIFIRLLGYHTLKINLISSTFSFSFIIALSILNLFYKRTSCNTDHPSLKNFMKFIIACFVIIFIFFCYINIMCIKGIIFKH